MVRLGSRREIVAQIAGLVGAHAHTFGHLAALVDAVMMALEHRHVGLVDQADCLLVMRLGALTQEGRHGDRRDDADDQDDDEQLDEVKPVLITPPGPCCFKHETRAFLVAL